MIVVATTGFPRMMGVVFQLLETCVVATYGGATWQRALQAVGSEGAYATHQRYDDEQFDALVAVIASDLGISGQAAHRWFGEAAIPHFYSMAPQFFDGHRDSWSFLLTLNDIIHPQVRSLYPGAHAPDFDFSSDDDGALVIGYRSPRRMCAFAEGLIMASMRHYGELPALTHRLCMHHGASLCEFVLPAPEGGQGP